MFCNRVGLISSRFVSPRSLPLSWEEDQQPYTQNGWKSSLDLYYLSHFFSSSVVPGSTIEELVGQLKKDVQFIIVSAR